MMRLGLCLRLQLHLKACAVCQGAVCSESITGAAALPQVSHGLTDSTDSITLRGKDRREIAAKITKEIGSEGNLDGVPLTSRFCFIFHLAFRGGSSEEDTSRMCLSEAQMKSLGAFSFGVIEDKHRR